MEEDFLTKYREYTSHTIVPRLYNEWGAILAISSVLGQKCWIERGYYRIYPNLYVMLIGKPGTGKGTAANILQGVLQDADYRIKDPREGPRPRHSTDTLLARADEVIE